MSVRLTWALTVLGLAVALSTGALLARPCAAQALPPAQVDYFLGESKVTTPTGKHLGTTVSLVKRDTQPAEGKVYEHVCVLDPKKAPKQFVVILEVKGAKFTLS